MCTAGSDTAMRQKTSETRADRADVHRQRLSFWRWFARSGVWKVLDWWLPVHLMLGFVLALTVSTSLADVAATAFLPLASILVGLAFAWAGNALAVLQTRELRQVASHPESPGYEAYLFTYQSAVLAVLVTLVAWGLAALGVAEGLGAAKWPPYARLAARSALFAATSYSIRECWQVMVATLQALIVQQTVSSAHEKKPCAQARHDPEGNE